MTFSPSSEQTRAIAGIKDWFWHRRTEQQVFSLFGYAGSGKSTLTAHAIAELGLDGESHALGSGGVLYAAFTGKAALVMTRKGTPASTIHSLIYRCSEATPEEIARVEQDLQDLRAGLGAMGPGERLFAETQIRHLELRLRDLHEPRFLLNEQSLLRDADLLVLDEVSMVGHEMAADLLAFGKPILVLGDPGQLPPMKGEGAFTRGAPDVMLTGIHRQAAESAIVRLATLARQGQPIPFGAHDAFVWTLRRGDVPPEQLLNGGQVICGRNDTRRMLNAAMKRAAGHPGAYPEGRGEKIICLKNRHDLGLVNGMFLELAAIEDRNEYCFTATVVTEDGETIPGRQWFYKGHFDDQVDPDRDRERRDSFLRRGLIESVWGYAITCHKAQGSQWENVIVHDDGYGRSAEDRARWLYTAITRAERGLVILQ
jgi:exodeoxyribonuclease V